jgi:predicted homoserine dehydrogenase-like protein
VFVIITTDQPKVVKDLRYLKLGKGPYWALYRPYHLANLETTLSAARAVIYGEATLAPKGPPMVEVLTIAKRDLKAGEMLDGIGGYTVYAGIDNADTAHAEGLLPLGLVEGARMKVAVAAGTPIQYAHVELNDRSVIGHLRRLQDALVFGGGLAAPALASAPEAVEAGER